MSTTPYKHCGDVRRFQRRKWGSIPQCGSILLSSISGKSVGFQPTHEGFDSPTQYNHFGGKAVARCGDTSTCQSSRRIQRR